MTERRPRGRGGSPVATQVRAVARRARRRARRHRPGPVRRDVAGRPGRRRHPARPRPGRPRAASSRRDRGTSCIAGRPLGRRRPQAPRGARRWSCGSSSRPTCCSRASGPGVIERLGLGPDDVPRAQPAARLRPDDRLGPGRSLRAARPGTTSTTSRSAGALARIGRAGRAPVPPLNLVGDFGGGGMLLAFGVVVRPARGAARRARARSSTPPWSTAPRC